MKMGTNNNPIWKAVVLESSVKPSLGKPWQAGLPRLGLTEDSRTTDSGCKTVQSARG